MKKIIVAACLILSTSGALTAQTAKSGSSTAGTNKNNPGYVDVNKNKTCDNYENNTRAFNGQGQATGRGRGAGYGKGNGQCNSAMPGCKTVNRKRSS